MNLRLDQSTVADLNTALQLYRRLMVRLLAILVLGFVAMVALAKLGTALSPPYGVYLFGMDLVSWGLMGVIALLIAESYWDGRQIGQVLTIPLCCPRRSPH